jgi:glycosyltransferase involved in cell wall biosynthesis
MIQSPAHIPKFSLLNRLKLFDWYIICYSQFMQKFIEDKLGKKADILSPCISLSKFKNDFSQKQNIILTVGRFFPYPHNKKHDLLIDIFRKNYQKYFTNWKLIIVGGLTEKGGREILADLKTKTRQLPIDLIVNPSFNQLATLYKKAKIYWHAAGYGEDVRLHPERVEHFGITTLEAMAAGAVPVVFAAGGQKDIVENGKNGYLWEKDRDSVGKTSQLINNEKLLEKLSHQAILRAADFSADKFYGKIAKIIEAP